MYELISYEKKLNSGQVLSQNPSILLTGFLFISHNIQIHLYIEKGFPQYLPT